MSSSSADGHAARPETVEVIFPSATAAAEAYAEVAGGYAASNEPISSAAPSCGSGNANPNDHDFESIVAKTLEKMPPEFVAMAKDPKRHAKSKDPGWKYGFWPYEGKRDMVQCIFCRKVVPAGIKRFKQHIAGGYGDVEKCPTAPATVRKELYDFLKKNARKELNLQQGREWDCEADGEGEAFSRPLAIKDRDRKNPVNWWGAYGGLAYELMSLAKKIVSLCCSASGCEHNWSTFSQIHTKRRNRLEHKRLNNLVFVSYNRKMTNRFAKLRELGSKGRKYNPLLLEEFQWENEWVDAACEPVHQGAAATDNDLTWVQVDEANGASQGLRGRNLPRAAAMKRKSISKSNIPAASKRSKQPRTVAIPIERIVEDEESSEEDDDMEDDSGSDYEDDEEDGEGGAAEVFQVDDAVL